MNAPLSLPADSLLKCLPLFADLDTAALAEIGRDARIVNLPRREPLFRSGTPIEDAYILISGAIRRYLVTTDGEDRLIEIVRERDLVAAAEVLVRETYLSWTSAVEPSVVLALPARALRRLLAKHAALVMRLLTALATRQNESQLQLDRHPALTAAQRLLEYLSRLPSEPSSNPAELTVTLPLSRQLLAGELGISPEALSRTLRRLADDGLIVVDGRRIHMPFAPLDAEAAAPSPRAGLARYRRAGGDPPGALPDALQLVNLAGRFRLLSQQIGTHWLLVRLDTRSESPASGPRPMIAQFKRHLRLLGVAADAGLIAERELTELRAAWAALAPGLSRHAPLAEQRRIHEGTDAVLFAADRLTRRIVEAHAPLAGQHIHLAGRNRMYCARVAKLHAYAGRCLPAAEAIATFMAADVEFRDNLAALRRIGLPGASVARLFGYIDDSWSRLMANARRETADVAGGMPAAPVLAESGNALRQCDALTKLVERHHRQGSRVRPR